VIDSTAPGGRLTDAEREFLLDLARRAVRAAAAGGPPPIPAALAEESGVALAPRLLEARGAFVTLTAQDRLRGCIGYIEGIKPLVEAVADNGAAAAVNDPRFNPVESAEVDDLMIEISALTPLHQVSGPAEIVVGRHGIVLAKAGRRSVFLPQVAPEQGWDVETTLTQLALKAGLGPDAWRTAAEFHVFEAEVFHGY